MRVALVHDWLVTHRGGEHVLLDLARLFPEAPIYTLVFRPEGVHPELRSRTIHTSFIQSLPGAPRRFRQYLPLFPKAVERWDFSSFDCVISYSHCVVKGVRTRNLHIAYVHTPMRYLWDQMPEYLPRSVLPLARLASTPLRRWDVASAQRANYLVANSHYVAKRIERVWGRTASVVYPGVDVEFFAAATPQPRHGYLVVSALVPYKRVHLAVQVANAQGLSLTVVGQGPELERLQNLAGPSVKFEGALDAPALRQHYARARALLFPGTEDFGIVPVEAMAAGCPVIAYAEGGATETVQANTTGVFFREATASALANAIADFETQEFSPEDLRARARNFGSTQFASQFTDLLRRATEVYSVER